MTSKFARVRGAKTLKIAAASSALAATAAIGGLSVSASAHTQSTEDSATYAAEQGPITGTRQCIEDTSEDVADQYESDRSDDEVAPTHANHKGGSPTGRAHSQRWHATAAHEGRPPSFAGNDSSTSTDESSGSKESGDDSTQSGWTGGSDDSRYPHADDDSGEMEHSHHSEHLDRGDREHPDYSDPGYDDQGQQYGDHGDDQGEQYGDHGGDDHEEHSDDGGEHDD
jgi:hypothetical protein